MPSPRKSETPRRVRSALCAAILAAAFAGCRLFAPAPTSAPPPAPSVSVDQAERLGGTLPAEPASPQSATAVVGEALAAANDVCGAHGVEQELIGDLLANPDTDARTEAWLRVDRAVVFAEVEATPSPDPRPVPVQLQTLARERTVGPGELHLYVPGTGDRVQARLYDASGRMRTEAIAELSWALRDRRADRARTIRPRVLAMLYQVGQHFDAELEVISGYRIRGVNASQGSRHGSAQACDFRVPGVGLTTVLAYVETSFASAGFGYYPNSGFVHVDERDRTYHWIDYSGPGERSRTRTRSSSRRADPAQDPTLRSFHVTEEQLYVLPPALRTVGYE